MTTKLFCQATVSLSLFIPFLFPFALLAFPGMVIFVIYLNTQIQRTTTPKQAARLLVKAPSSFIPFGFSCFLIFSLISIYKISGTTSAHTNVNNYLLLNGALIEAATLSLAAWIISYLYLGISGTIFYFIQKYGFISDLKPSSHSAVVSDGKSSDKIEKTEVLVDEFVDDNVNTNLKKEKFFNFIFYLTCAAVLIIVYILAAQMMSFTNQ